MHRIDQRNVFNISANKNYTLKNISWNQFAAWYVTEKVKNSQKKIFLPPSRIRTQDLPASDSDTIDQISGFFHQRGIDTSLICIIFGNYEEFTQGWK